MNQQQANEQGGTRSLRDDELSRRMLLARRFGLAEAALYEAEIVRRMAEGFAAGERDIAEHGEPF